MLGNFSISLALNLSMYGINKLTLFNFQFQQKRALAPWIQGHKEMYVRNSWWGWYKKQYF